MTPAYEVNFDGIVGMSHNYAGLSPDNFASLSHQGKVSHPKQAALQGLEKMKFLMDLGLKQAILPPQRRPYLPLLKSDFLEIDLEKVENSLLLAQASSAAAMWAANACTTTPSSDSLDNRLQITPANLLTEAHRRIEAETTFHVLREIFKNKDHFKVHLPLKDLPDEGAANHTRLCPSHTSKGLHLFCYGNPGRQSLEASKLIAKLHGIEDDYCLLIQQNPKAIEAGVFHNDVICVGNESILFLHQEAFLNQPKVLQEISTRYKALFNQNLNIIEVPSSTLSLREAVRTYLFNSQLLTLPDGTSLLLAPQECQNLPFLKNPPFDQVHYINVKESMQNGGGPACLRCRFVLTEQELNALNGRILLDNSLYTDLKQWINTYYPETLTLKDIATQDFLTLENSAMHALLNLIQINPYPSHH